LFLEHVPSAIIPIFTIPVICISGFYPAVLHGGHFQHHVLAGIFQLSIGVLVDGALVEWKTPISAWKNGSRAAKKGDFHAIRLAALQEVGPSVFLFAARDRRRFPPRFHAGDGRQLFSHSAYSRPWPMAMAAIPAVTLDPPCACFSRVWIHRLQT